MTDIAAPVETTIPGRVPGGVGGHVLRKDVRLSGLTMISLGSVIGSGWLLGELGAAGAAGPASVFSWILAGLILVFIALVYCELGATYAVSGGTARFPHIGFGALGGFTGGWMAFMQAVTIAPIEVEAAETYLSSKYNIGLLITSGPNTGSLTGKGIALAAGFMILFSIINIMGIRWLAETNTIATTWKVIVPTLTFIALFAVDFHSHNFNSATAGGFAPFGTKGVFSALPLGVVFALLGFEQAAQVAGESKNPQRDVPRAILLAFGIGTVIYLCLQFAFIGGIYHLTTWVHGGLSTTNAFGPYAALASHATLGWLVVLLYIDAVISPSGTGLCYIGTASRLSYGMGRNRWFPRWVDWIDRRGIPIVSIGISFVIGMLVFLPFGSWAGLVGFVTSATCLMYALAPVALGALRRSDPDRARPFRLPAAGIICPVSFVGANLIVYWAGWSTVFWMYMIIIFGGILFAIYRLSVPHARQTVLDWRAASWIIPWLGGMAIISWQGQFNGATPTIFGLTLTNTNNLPFWWDLVVVAFWSLVIYFWAVRVGLTKSEVAGIAADVEHEAKAEEPLWDTL